MSAEVQDSAVIIRAACYFSDSEKAVTVMQQKIGISFAALPLIA
jgi:hypothetical protein